MRNFFPVAVVLHEVLQLHVEHGGLKFVKAAVAACILEYILALRAVVCQGADGFGKCRVVSGDGTAVAKCAEVLAGVERMSCGITDTACYSAVGMLAAVCLGIVLDQLQVVFPAQHAYLVGISVTAIEMYYGDGLGAWRDGLLYAVVVNLQRMGLRFHQDRLQPVLGDGEDGGNIGVGRYNDLIAWLHNPHFNVCTEYPDECIEAVGASHTIACPDEIGIMLLKALVLFTLQVPAAVDHAGHGLVYFSTVQKRDMSEQLLDNMDLERERGITIKAQTVRLKYTASDGNEYILNLIDTPGHVDFTYEVSRSLAACEGALLVVDATQGVEAQTLSNVYLALDHDLEIIPVINKIDLPSADVDRAKTEIEEAIGLDASDAVSCSAKTGEGVENILEAIVKKIPPPEGDAAAPLQALIFDSYFDSYKGAVAHVRLMNGKIRKGDKLKLIATGKEFDATEIGIFTPNMNEVAELTAGEVGYICGSLKDVRDVRVGDTITNSATPAEALEGYRAPVPMVFCGLYPTESVDYDNLKEALEKLQLNDAALVYEPETSAALGFGFRCGFLGLLHMDVVQERLEREYNLKLVTTAPSVVYRVNKTDGEVLTIDNPAALPPPTEIKSVEEPIVKATVIVPSDYIGAVMELCREKRGTYKSMDYIDKTRVMISYSIPLNEIIYDFFDKLKSMTRGYASLDYEPESYSESDLVKLDILLNGDLVDALSSIVHRTRAAKVGRTLALKLKRIIPEQLFDIPVQAAIGGRIIARETVKARRKDVLAKCYGGDVSRKRKLLEKQKEGKKRMKAVGSVELPQEAFMAVLTVGDEI